MALRLSSRGSPFSFLFEFLLEPAHFVPPTDDRPPLPPEGTWSSFVLGRRLQRYSAALPASSDFPDFSVKTKVLPFLTPSFLRNVQLCLIIPIVI